MAIPTITPLPAPPIRGTDTGPVFSNKTAAFLDALHDVFQPELNQFALDLVDAAAAANYSATSTTPLTIGTGTKSLTIEQGKMFDPGQPIAIADAAAPTTNWMFGQVVAHWPSIGAMSVDVARSWGSGTKSLWFVALSGPQGPGSDTLPSFTGNVGKVLAVNAAATGTEWLDHRWVPIGTLNPSAAAQVTFTSIPAVYSDLLCVFNLDRSQTTTLYTSISPDNSNFSASSATVASSEPGTARGAIHIPGKTFGHGVLSTWSTTGASPSIVGGTTSTGNHGWRCDGGISALRITPTAGTVTGTATLYGRL